MADRIFHVVGECQMVDAYRDSSTNMGAMTLWLLNLRVWGFSANGMTDIAHSCQARPWELRQWVEVQPSNQEHNPQNNDLKMKIRLVSLQISFVVMEGCIRCLRVRQELWVHWPERQSLREF